MTPESDQRRRIHDREWRIAALAERQHGVVALSQLRELGLSARAVTARTALGRFHRVHQGVYSLGRRDLRIEGRWFAAVLASGDGALLSHRSAASLHGLLASAQTAVDITIPRRTALSRFGLRVHRSTRLTPVDRTAVRGIPCTSVPLTLLDLAAVVPRAVLERTCDQAEVLRVLDMAAVNELLQRSAGRPGVRALRTVLGTGAVGEQFVGSPLERELLDLCKRARLPLPSINEWLAIEGEEWQFDFVWRAQRLVVEADGWATHRTRRAFREDRRRDRLLRLAGWEVVRFTWDDVVHDAARVEREVRSLIAEARTLEARSGSRSS